MDTFRRARNAERRRGGMLRASGLALGAFALSLSLPALGPANKTPLNVLLISVDTLRADRLGCYGGAGKLTPSIDALARTGFVFERAFAHATTTLPSHTSLMTGTTPLRHGVHDNVNFVVPTGVLTLAERLKAAGYATAAFVGAFPLDSRFGLTRGFDVYDDHYGAGGSQEFGYIERKAETVIRLGCEWLENRADPWFLWLHCFDPHLRYDPPEPFKTGFKDAPYDGEVAYVDFALARIFDALRARGLMERTVIVLTGDHGEALNEHGEVSHGYFAYNATLHVPLIIRVPSAKPGRSKSNVSHSDVFPTLCDLLDLSRPAGLEGLSLGPLLEGRTIREREIYFESLYPYYSRGWAPLRGIIAGTKKYIDSPIPEFYDLGADFGEKTNLAETADLSRFRDILRRLIESDSSRTAPSSPAAQDRRSREKLESLGYVASFRGPTRKSFSEADDLKVLLPYQTKLMKAMGAYHRGELDQGANLLREIIVERSDFDLAYTYLATIRKDQGRTKEALDVLRSGYRANPSSYRIVTAFGIILAEAGAPDEAIAVLKEGLALVGHDPELWNYLGVAYWQKGAYGDARAAYERALALDPDHPVVLNNLGSLFLGQHQKSKDRIDLARAIDSFAKAISLAPDYASPYNGLGTALARSGEIDKALTHWEKAVELKPDFAYPLYNLGATYAAKGDKARALKYLLKYKERFYGSLSARDKNDLDALIQSCRK